jgi:hypothetical protein
MKKTALLTVMTILLFACKKNEVIEDKKGNSSVDIPKLMIGVQIDPEGFIQSYSFYNGDYHQYQFYAYFKDDPDDQNCVNVDSVIANNVFVPIYTAENNNYKISLASVGVQPVTNWLQDTLDIFIKGMGNFVTQNIKHPSLVEFTTFTLNGVTGSNNSHNKSNSLNLTWNQGSSTDDVYIELVFIEDGINNNGNTTLTNYVKVQDNGSYTLPSSFFNNFPSNSLCLINIYRGHYDNYTASNNKDIGVLTYTKATQKITLQ